MGLGTLWDPQHRNLISGTTAPLLYTGQAGNLGSNDVGETGANAIIEGVFFCEAYIVLFRLLTKKYELL